MHALKELLSFKENSSLITIVNNEEIFFIKPDVKDEGRIMSLPTLQIMKDQSVRQLIPEFVGDCENNLLIVPDYWFEFNTLKFQSRKKVLVKSFLERKLTSDYPKQPDILNFYDYKFFQTASGGQEIFTFFLNDAKFFELYDLLGTFSLFPTRISSPAFIWEQKIDTIIPDILNDDICYIFLSAPECFFYFFSNGNFLFSRNIILPEVKKGSREDFDQLTYEIKQSIYLFSQKTKSEIDQIYLLSTSKKDIHDLSNMLGRDIINLNPLFDMASFEPVFPKDLGPVGAFTAEDIDPDQKYVNISHKSVKEELRWTPVQYQGIVAGAVLAALLFLQALFIFIWSYANTQQLSNSQVMADLNQKFIIMQYNQSLDTILMEAERLSPRDIFIKIAKSLPENLKITSIEIEVENLPVMDLRGEIRAKNPEILKNTLTELVNNLNQNIQSSQPININDIEFNIDKNNQSPDYQKYMVSFRFGLI
jgi:hypothetical protein